MHEEERSEPAGGVFLSAEWRDLAMLNYTIDPRLLSAYVPRGTELDSFEGKTFISLVGFRFLRTKLFGIFPVPFHTNFDEVNLRFYVRRSDGGVYKRGVVFICEIVPRRAIAQVARLAYAENYICLPMKHHVAKSGAQLTVEYQWLLNRRWCRLHAQVSDNSTHAAEGSLEKFITEHYWGYAAQRDGGCKEYRVEHVPWRVWAATDAGVDGDCSAVYGPEFARVLARQPDSTFIADGSPVRVFHGERIS
jgi:uncharacterized protein